MPTVGPVNHLDNQETFFFVCNAKFYYHFQKTVP